MMPWQFDPNPPTIFKPKVINVLTTSKNVASIMNDLQELHSRAMPSVEAHHSVNSLVTGRNSERRWIKKNNEQFF